MKHFLTIAVILGLAITIAVAKGEVPKDEQFRNYVDMDYVHNKYALNGKKDTDLSTIKEFESLANGRDQADLTHLLGVITHDLTDCPDIQGRREVYFQLSDVERRWKKVHDDWLHEGKAVEELLDSRRQMYDEAVQMADKIKQACPGVPEAEKWSDKLVQFMKIRLDMAEQQYKNDYWNAYFNNIDPFSMPARYYENDDLWDDYDRYGTSYHYHCGKTSTSFTDELKALYEDEKQLKRLLTNTLGDTKLIDSLENFLAERRQIIESAFPSEQIQRQYLHAAHNKAFEVAEQKLFPLFDKTQKDQLEALRKVYVYLLERKLAALLAQNWTARKTSKLRTNDFARLQGELSQD